MAVPTLEAVAGVSLSPSLVIEDDPAIARHILGWLAAQGLSIRDMAESLSISRLTVGCHTKNIYRKLAVSARTEAVYQARRHGLLH